jgi:hypothetical protein
MAVGDCVRKQAVLDCSWRAEPDRISSAVGNPPPPGGRSGREDGLFPPVCGSGAGNVLSSAVGGRSRVAAREKTGFPWL